MYGSDFTDALKGALNTLFALAMLGVVLGALTIVGVIGLLIWWIV